MRTTSWPPWGLETAPEQRGGRQETSKDPQRAESLAEAGGWAQRAPRSPPCSPVPALCPSCREGPRPARSKLDELLGRGAATTHLAHRGTGEPLELKLDRRCQRPQGEEACGTGRWGGPRAGLAQPIITTKLYIGTHTLCPFIKETVS